MNMMDRFLFFAITVSMVVVDGSVVSENLLSLRVKGSNQEHGWVSVNNARSRQM